MGKCIVVVGGQFGSEAKGHIAAYLGDQVPAADLMAVRVGGPNAGHTVVDGAGRHVAFRSLPVAALRHGVRCCIAAGSEVDVQVLNAELDLVRDTYGFDVRHFVDGQATVLEAKHQEAERMDGLQARIGSTSKGIGAARVDRLWRSALIWRDYVSRFSGDVWSVQDLALEHLQDGGTVLIEGTQGYGLGLHAGFYPYCTSGDARAIDFLAQVGISPWDPAVTELEVWVVLRTYPIRVAGNSGPLKDELTWADMEVETGGYVTQPEYTTVTKKPRRIGRWDADLANRAINANGRHNVHVALTFADYVDPHLAGITDAPWGRSLWDRGEHRGQELARSSPGWLSTMEHQLGMPIELVGTGPASLIDRRA